MHLPADWTRILPPDAPLTTLERWERVFADTKPGDWPEGVDRSSFVLDILRLLAKGTVVAAEAGERLLPTLARKLSDRALEDGPPVALPVTLASLRIEDGLEPASHPIWTSAVSLASAPRPFVGLLGLNAGRWQRRISEDRLIPDHIIPIEEVDPLPLADADRRDFATIIASAQSAIISFSRRDVEGRLLGRSPLIADFKESYLNRSRTPEHCTSEFGSKPPSAPGPAFVRRAVAVRVLGSHRHREIVESERLLLHGDVAHGIGGGAADGQE